jgi:hypothetical protein
MLHLPWYQPVQQCCHLDGGTRCIEAFIARPGFGALDRLFDRFGRHHPKGFRWVLLMSGTLRREYSL